MKRKARKGRGAGVVWRAAAEGEASESDRTGERKRAKPGCPRLIMSSVKSEV